MKTITNFRKVAIRFAAVIVSFILVSITVSAQEFWKKLITNSSFNEIALALAEPDKMTEPKQSTETGCTDWKQFDMAFDPAVEMKSWMSDEEHFKNIVVEDDIELITPLTGEVSFLDSDFKTNLSEFKKFEDWMVQDGI